jgi:hypothetical protein
MHTCNGPLAKQRLAGEIILNQPVIGEKQLTHHAEQCVVEPVKLEHLAERQVSFDRL